MDRLAWIKQGWPSCPDRLAEFLAHEYGKRDGETQDLDHFLAARPWEGKDALRAYRQLVDTETGVLPLAPSHLRVIALAHVTRESE